MRSEATLGFAKRTAPQTPARGCADAVELSAVGRYHIFHIAGIFKAPFDLERPHSGVDHIFEHLQPVHIAERKQVLATDELVARTVLQIKAVAAYLSALAAVGAPSGQYKTGLTVAAVAHTQRSVHKRLQGHIHRLVHRPDLPELVLPRKHELRKSRGLKHGGLLRGADIALGGCVQGYRRQVHPQQRHILHYQGIDPDSPQLPHEPTHLLGLLFVHQRIDRNIHLHTECVSILHYPCHIGYRVGGLMSRSKSRSAHIHGVGAMIDSGDGCVGITCRGQKLQRGDCLSGVCGFYWGDLRGFHVGVELLRMQS